MEPVKIQTHCPKCEHPFLTTLEEPVLGQLGLQRKSVETEAKLNDAEAEVIRLKDALKQDPSPEAMEAYLSDVITEDTWRRLGKAKGFNQLLGDFGTAEGEEGEAKLAEDEAKLTEPKLPEVLTSAPDPAVADKYDQDPKWNLWTLKHSDKTQEA